MKTDYKVKVKDFEGPLELLLNLIEARELSINEVSLAAVTEEYFDYINVLKRGDSGSYHEQIASFIVIAATLMVIKSRSLLPMFTISDEEETDIKELEERLRTYKIVKELAGRIARNLGKRHPMYSRAPYVMVAPSFLPPQKPLEFQKMLGYLKAILQAIPKKIELPQIIVKKIISLEEKIKELERRIEEGVVRTFRDFIGSSKEKLEIIVSFLAMLELVKLGSIAVQQSAPFDLIHIHGPGKNN